jgi:hypothetical protein
MGLSLGRDPAEWIVLLEGEQVKLKDVPLGREFTYEGRIFQSTKNPMRFMDLPPSTRFCYRDRWLYRGGLDFAYALDPDAPFGNVTEKRVEMPYDAPVELLDFEDRSA